MAVPLQERRAKSKEREWLSPNDRYRGPIFAVRSSLLAVPQHRDLREVPVVAVVVQAVAHDKLIGDIEADVLGGDLLGTRRARLLAEENGDAERRGLLLEDEAADQAQRPSGVQDVIHDQDVLACEVGGDLG